MNEKAVVIVNGLSHGSHIIASTFELWEDADSGCIAGARDCVDWCDLCKEPIPPDGVFVGQ